MPLIKTSDGTLINYVESGSGKPIVLIGGWTITIAWWQKQIATLSNKYRVIAIDPRAYGLSEKVSYGHRLSRHAIDIYDLLTALDIDDATLVGWSLGANVLFAYWEIYRNARISKLVHIDQTPFNLITPDWQFGLQGFGCQDIPTTLCNAIKENHPAQINNIIDNCFAYPPSSTDKKWMVEEVLKTPTKSAVSLLWNHLNTDWRDMVKTVSIPVLIVTGRKSKLFDWQSGVWLYENLPNSQHIIFEQSGHCPFFEEPTEFNIALEKFVAK